MKSRTVWELLAALDMRLHMLKTSLWYKWKFGRIGSRTIVRKPLSIVNGRYISLGRKVLIRDGARLEVIPRPGEPLPSVTIGDNVTVEQDFHLACCGSITIGDNVSIAARCAVVDITHPFWKVDVSENLAGAILEGPQKVSIGRRVFLGLGVTILPNVEIGEGAVIGPHSVVMTDIPPFCVAAGIPAKVIRFWK
jgi:acetyltransferase-like isoleucine patch superfamily enzyme